MNKHRWFHNFSIFTYPVVTIERRDLQLLTVSFDGHISTYTNLPAQSDTYRHESSGDVVSA